MTPPAAIAATAARTYPVLGSFSKAVKGGVSLNFCTSGGKHCDRLCRHHPASARPGAACRCYAVRIEKWNRRKQLLNKLVRHEATDPAEIVRRGLGELQRIVNRGHKVPWLRLSTNGSLPAPKDASDKFLNNLRVLLAFCKEHNIPVHLPIETSEKTGFYRAALGDLVVVRESTQTEEDFLALGGAVSFTAGHTDQTRLGRLETARDLARRRRELTGRVCFVCPAIGMRFANKNVPNPKAKCGRCVACARARFDVTYPIH